MEAELDHRCDGERERSYGLDGAVGCVGGHWLFEKAGADAIGRDRGAAPCVFSHPPSMAATRRYYSAGSRTVATRSFPAATVGGGCRHFRHSSSHRPAASQRRDSQTRRMRGRHGGHCHPAKNSRHSWRRATKNGGETMALRSTRPLLSLSPECRAPCVARQAARGVASLHQAARDVAPLQSADQSARPRAVARDYPPSAAEGAVGLIGGIL